MKQGVLHHSRVAECGWSCRQDARPRPLYLHFPKKGMVSLLTIDSHGENLEARTDKRWCQYLRNYFLYSACKFFSMVTQCEFYSTAKRLESYQEAGFEEDECADALSGSISNMAKPRAQGCRTVPRGPLGSKPSTHLSGSATALGSGEGSGEVPHSRQAAFSSPIVSVATSPHPERNSALVRISQTALLFLV